MSKKIWSTCRIKQTANIDKIVKGAVVDVVGYFEPKPGSKLVVYVQDFEKRGSSSFLVVSEDELE